MKRIEKNPKAQRVRNQEKIKKSKGIEQNNFCIRFPLQKLVKGGI